MAGEIRMYGTTWCGDCRRAKKFLGEQRVAYRWVNVEEDEVGMRFVEQANNGLHRVPTIVFPDGSLLVEPSNAQLAEKLGLDTRARSDFYDLIVVGGGPAGLMAAIYAAREGVDTLVVERASPGGQAGMTERLDNFPGFPEGVNGDELADRLTNQARRFGVEILQAQEVREILRADPYRMVRLASGDEHCAKAILLATGSRYRQLNVPGERGLIGINVHYCATCDGPFYKGKEVLVVGGGNSGVEEGIFLTRFATRVTIVESNPQLKASQILQEKAYRHPQIGIITNVEVQELRGQRTLEAVILRDRATGELRELQPAGVFVFIGLTPNSALVKDLVELDEFGFIVSDLTLQTSVPGIFAAGDVRKGSTKQASAATGEGTVAALMIREYLKTV